MNAPLRRQAGRDRLRVRLEEAVERLLAALDAMDGDPDLEDGADDEPSLGSVGHHHPTWSRGSCQDLEEEADLETDPAEWGIGDGDGLLEQIGFAWGRAE